MVMLYDQPPGEDPAWHKDSDTAWAAYHAAVHAAAVKRGEDETAGDDSDPPERR